MTVLDATAEVGGAAAPGYGPVYDTFAAGLTEFDRGGGAFAAYVDGVKVVDLWGGVAASGQAWGEDTLAVLMSVTKGFVALCVQLLVDRGQLDVAAPVATYWPEFAAAGKENVLIRHVLTHTSGVLAFPGQSSLLGKDGSGWDRYAEIAAGLAAAEPSWPVGTRHGYHGLSVGWLVAELVRRISGRSLGVFFADEVAKPLGLDARIGTTGADFTRVAPMIKENLDGLPDELRAIVAATQQQLRDPRTLAGQAFAAGGGESLFDSIEELINNPRFLALEMPAGNGTATARALARLFAMLAAGGTLDGVRLLQPATVHAFSTVQVRDVDAIMGELVLPGIVLEPEIVARSLGFQVGPQRFGQPRFGPSPHAFGVEGHGGQLAFCDPDRGIAVAYVRNHLRPADTFSTHLIDVLYRCAGG